MNLSKKLMAAALGAAFLSAPLHAGASEIGRRPPKLAFFAADVASARASLMKRGARFGPIKSTAHFDMCDGKDPDGNPISLSSRR